MTNILYHLSFAWIVMIVYMTSGIPIAGAMIVAHLSAYWLGYAAGRCELGNDDPKPDDTFDPPFLPDRDTRQGSDVDRQTDVDDTAARNSDNQVDHTFIFALCLMINISATTS